MAYWESKLRSQQATKVTASHEGGGAGFRPAGQNLQSRTPTEQATELLGIDLSIWSGLVSRCPASGKRAAAEMTHSHLPGPFLVCKAWRVEELTAQCLMSFLGFEVKLVLCLVFNVI